MESKETYEDSFAQLELMVPKTKVHNSQKLSTYYAKALQHRILAAQYHRAGEFERAYIYNKAYLGLVIEQIPTHNLYDNKQYSREKIRYRKVANSAIDDVISLKTALRKQWSTETQQVCQQPTSQATQESLPCKQDDLPAVSTGTSNTTSTESLVSDWSNLRIDGNYKQEKPPPVQNASPSPYSNLVPPKAVLSSYPSFESMSRLDSKKSIQIPSELPHSFLPYAAANTRNNTETCGILCGKVVSGGFVIIPKQTGDANNCQMEAEEELVEATSKLFVVTLGWIHTHPTQTAFLSSVDLHCQVSYQLMIPESIAIVMAPSKNNFETFTLTQKGMDVLKKCASRGFHPHDDADSLYSKATHSTYSSSLKCQFVDLR